ncbi:hypothetical protein MG293_015147 [Ovis ammon polii]|uniref:Uncharacterized protein n=1 Tax=Ovis ammon polii TaxID=230172 RepID=A0AAD4TU43_OVIAM|nr:hypothetical protein MG293_015147 [Ovis ammon polii]
MEETVCSNPLLDIICKLVGSGLITLFEFDSVALSGDTGNEAPLLLCELEKKLSSCSYILHAVPFPHATTSHTFVLEQHKPSKAQFSHHLVEELLSCDECNDERGPTSSTDQESWLEWKLYLSQFWQGEYSRALEKAIIQRPIYIAHETCPFFMTTCKYGGSEQKI